MKQDDNVLLFQPNLMCKYILTQTPDLRMRTLTAINHDEAGINDEQIVTSLWSWVKEFSRKLQNQNAKPPRHIPTCDVMINFSKDRQAYTVVAISHAEDIMLEDMVLAIILGNFCGMLADQMNMKLEGMHGAENQPTIG